jgi:hypothetical protein
MYVCKCVTVMHATISMALISLQRRLPADGSHGVSKSVGDFVHLLCI